MNIRNLASYAYSPSTEAVWTLIHSFVSSRVDYWNCLMAGAPKKVTQKLRRIMNPAASILTQMKKYDKGLTWIFHDKLHWLDVSDTIQIKLCIHVYKCLHDIEPKYMMFLSDLHRQLRDAVTCVQRRDGRLMYHVQSCKLIMG